MQKKKFPHLFAALLFPAFFIYYEILFRFTTVRGLFQIGTVFTILFCWGSPRRWPRKRIFRRRRICWIR